MEYKLKECTLNITDGTHSTVIDDENGSCFLLSCKNIKNGNIIIGDKERKISEETLAYLRKRTKLAKGDVLITTVGTIGELAYIDDENLKFEFQRSVGIIKPDERIILPEFLYYTLKSSNVMNKIKQSVKGAVQQCLFLSEIKELKIDIPEKDIQNKVVNVLKKLDNKIKINNQINDNLYNVA